MDANDFRKRGKEMVDYIADYMETISRRRVTPDIEPGYLAAKLPRRAPTKGEEFDEIMCDVDKYIMPGITHWQHPDFHAFFPAGNSYPSILGDMLSNAIGCVGFSWAASPACTELEIIVLDWFGKMIGLPDSLLHEGGLGGGVIQGSASECVLVTMLAARHSKLKSMRNESKFVADDLLLSKLVAYSSKLAHSCVEKAGMISMVKMRQLDVDANFALRGHVLEQAFKEDRRLGLIPFYVCATLGTTACCSFDNLEEIGAVCPKEQVWLHVDAAYAGNAFICAENQHYLKGIEDVNSFNCNPNKWMLVNFDCSLMWVKQKDLLISSMTVDPLYLQHKHDDKVEDFRHWGIPLSRRFRALKLWFVIRTYGVEGLQRYIRLHTRLAKLFEALVKSDARFEVIGKVTMGLVCFRLKGPNSLTQKLNRMINDSGRLYTVPAQMNEKYVIRFAVCAQDATEADIEYGWRTIVKEASRLLDRRMLTLSTIKANNIDQSEGEIENERKCDADIQDFEDEMLFQQQGCNFQKSIMSQNLSMRKVPDHKFYSQKATPK